MARIVAGCILAVAFCLTSTVAHAQGWRPPAESQRCPSKWGAGDERGSGNHMKPRPCCAPRGSSRAVKSSRSRTCSPTRCRSSGRAASTQALQRQNMQLQAGDAILINTGWNKLWAKDNARYVKSCPGIGVAAATWLAAQDPMIVGSDNWPVEVAPNPDPNVSLPVHQIMLVVNGIRFSGSTVAPIAVR